MRRRNADPASFHASRDSTATRSWEIGTSSTDVIRRLHSLTSDHGSEGEICLQAVKRSSTRLARTVSSEPIAISPKGPMPPVDLAIRAACAFMATVSGRRSNSSRQDTPSAVRANDAAPAGFALFPTQRHIVTTVLCLSCSKSKRAPTLPPRSNCCKQAVTLIEKGPTKSNRDFLPTE